MTITAIYSILSAKLALLNEIFYKINFNGLAFHSVKVLNPTGLIGLLGVSAC